MSINFDAIQAITEYVRQRKLLSKDLGPVVHGVFSDPEAEMADLTVDHLEALLAYARDLEARIERVEAVHKPKSWTKYGIPCFDEFDSPTARINGCTCGCEHYPCPTIAALTATEGQA